MSSAQINNVYDTKAQEAFDQTNIAPAPSPPEYSAAIPNINAGFAKLNLASSGTGKLPTPDDCIVHLKLLSALYSLREDVSSKTDLFAISDSLAQVMQPDNPEKGLMYVREKRWSVYVQRAVSRFELWYEKCVPSVQNRLKQSDMAPGGRLSGSADLGDQQAYNDPDKMPPLDYCPTPKAADRFETLTGLSWDNLQDLPTKRISCPKCRGDLDCPWTTCNLQNSTSSPYKTLQEYLELGGSGYGDSRFLKACQKCSLVITHDLLRVQKFRQDLEDLLKNNYPMPGTILSLQGLPQASLDPAKNPVTFPNRLLTAGLKSSILELSDLKDWRNASRTVADIRDAIAAAFKERSLIRKANSNLISTKTARDEKVAVRRMMSRYWFNHSPFALDLAGAVIRQGSFIEKMYTIDWLHSPALSPTMARLLEKYGRFFSIMAKFPQNTAVPTLDVDLAWHTHQTAPRSYYDYSVSLTKIFIDHDDKIEENKLSDAFTWTSKQYAKMFGQVYSECTCWYCEATRESYTQNSSRLFGSASATQRIHDRFGEAHANSPTDPAKAPHISAHGAVRLTTSSTIERIKRLELETSYERACQRAKKKGRTAPPRDTYFYYGYPYGYPLGVVAPYYADPCVTPGLYTANPACMSVSSGAAGNCAQGTCGGTVAAGNCGSTFGGCAGGCGGGNGGGCAGGSGGGCGGGGGGCGGGGGGCGGGGGS
ncbi:MAG: hypothetical protein M1829_003427 [Trizodia sp. TS-e1964]|nr:MAG: hypothetical protein M1829_003427 [Trizodia sp. TS-e1964]